MCFYDCESPSFYNESYPKARKQHRCCECGRAIAKGEKYRRVSGKWEGDLATYSTCRRCCYMHAVVVQHEHQEGCTGPEAHCPIGEVRSYCAEVDIPYAAAAPDWYDFESYIQSQCSTQEV